MADPVIVPCPVNAWTKVATNVKTGLVHILKTDPAVYKQTYRLTGGAAPTNDDGAVPFCGQLEISSTDAIDVYIKAVLEDGNVRVDL